MEQWDVYLEVSDYAREHNLLRKREPLFFKKADEGSYRNFRQVMQLIDSMLLDIQTYQYKVKMLVCSMLYLVIGKELGEFSAKRITTEFPGSSMYLRNESDFNDLFCSFCNSIFTLELDDLLPTMQYCATFFALPLNYETHEARELVDSRGISIEEYSSYQTYNCHTLATVNKRNRAI